MPAVRFQNDFSAEIQAHLRQIADREGVKIDDRALSYIVKASEGSMRDAQSLLDQIISFSGQEVVDEDVRDVLGFIPSEILDRTLDALADRDSKALLENIGIVIDQGLNIQQYVREFIGRIRDLLVMKLGLDDKVLGSAGRKARLADTGRTFSEQDLIRFFDMLLRLENELRWTSQPRFHLEVGFIKLAKIGHVRDIEEVIRERESRSPGPRLESASAASANARPAALPSNCRLLHNAATRNRPKKALHRNSPLPTFSRAGSRTDPATTAVYLQKADRIERTDNGVSVILSTNAAHDHARSRRSIKAVLDAVASELVGKAVSVSLIMKEQAASNWNNRRRTRKERASR